jgi:hypothetical protein
MLSPLSQAQAWSAPSFCPPGALPSPSRGRVGSQRPETANESGKEGRAPTGTRPRHRLAHGQTACTAPKLETCKRTCTGTLPRRRHAHGQTTRPAPLQRSFTRTEWTSPDSAEWPLDPVKGRRIEGQTPRTSRRRRTNVAGGGRDWSADGPSASSPGHASSPGTGRRPGSARALLIP